MIARLINNEFYDELRRKTNAFAAEARWPFKLALIPCNMRAETNAHS